MVTTEQIESLRPKLCSHARRWGVSREEAEDIAQNVVIKLWRSGDRIRPETLSNFALRTLQRAMIDRKRQLDRRLDYVLESEALDEMVDLSGLMSDPAADRAFQNVIDPIEDSAPYRALGDLDPIHSSAVLAVDVHGLPHAFVADRIGIPLATLRTRLFRGRQLLRAALN